MQDNLNSILQIFVVLNCMKICNLYAGPFICRKVMMENNVYAKMCKKIKIEDPLI